MPESKGLNGALPPGALQQIARIQRCPICLCREHREFFRKGERSLLLCRSCRHVWWDLFPSNLELSRYYAQTYAKTHQQQEIQNQVKEYYSTHLNELLGWIRQDPAHSQIGDYGCSIPTLLAQARKAGFRRAVGFDYCEDSQRFADEFGVEVLSPERASEVIPDEALDIIRFSHTLEHTTDPCSVLRATLRMLRPGGLVYITQPSFPVFRYEASKQDLKDTVYPEHLQFFSPISLLELAGRLRLEVKQFFTHKNEDQIVKQYRGHIDLDYANARLSGYAATGSPAWPALGNYPYYAGENSVLYAFKRPA